jgi:predicted ATP-dependent endonuclease of OLD family
MKSIEINCLAQIDNAKIDIVDMTIFTGAQATGKSIVLQLLKLILDGDHIAKTIKKYGYDWDHEWKNFLELYFGEGMGGIWNEKTEVKVDNKKIDFRNELYKTGKAKQEQMFFIPAQRVLTLKNGWPRNFGDYESVDPYVVKSFSENIRLLMEAGIGKGESPIFPQEGRLKSVFRKKINDSIFNGAKVKLDKSGFRKRIVLDVENNRLPFMVWSAGQREFMPLLLGLYWLLPSSKITRRKGVEYVIIEESEMGLHPKAISSLVLVFLELLHRGYKVILSTHSPIVLDVIWAIGIIQKHHADPTLLMKLFELPKAPGIEELCHDIVKNKKFKSYYFDKDSNGKVKVKDISSLDPGAEDERIAGWGGLTAFSGKASEVVAKAVSGVL